ncbi:MAG: hypothetical protein KKH94_12110 [Candidatus Omnitrophica bacterium]|nr:hypothetical protein [Candidatus Omnitrophota bacterium]
MFFHRQEKNWITEEHKSPLWLVFIFGGIAGLLSTFHFILSSSIDYYDNVQLLEALASGWCFSGVLSIGLFRAIEYSIKNNTKLKKGEGKLSHLWLPILLIAIITSGSAVLGIAPLAFIDFVGGGLIGVKESLDDFYMIVYSALCLGGSLGFCIGLFIRVGVILRVVSQRWFLVLFPVCGSIVGCSIARFFLTSLPNAILYYGVLYGISFGVALIIKKKKD